MDNIINRFQETWNNSLYIYEKLYYENYKYYLCIL